MQPERVHLPVLPPGWCGHPAEAAVSALPPLGDIAPPLQCNRLLEWPDQASRCGKPATWHVIWTSDMENGLACDEHYDEARSTWAYFAVHPYRMECSMPGAVYVHAENVCRTDEDSLGLPSLVEAAEVPA